MWLWKVHYEIKMKRVIVMETMRKTKLTTTTTLELFLNQQWRKVDEAVKITMKPGMNLNCQLQPETNKQSFTGVSAALPLSSSFGNSRRRP